MIHLGKKFRFGYYTSEDLRQEAYILAWECLPRWDRKRSLPAFIYSHLYKRLCNLKRNKYERIEPPCTHCPINAYKKKKCTAYTNLEDCKYYSEWLARNKFKRNLMNWQVLPENEDSCYTDQFDDIDLQDEYEHILSLFPIERQNEITEKGISIDDINYAKEKLRESDEG